MSETVSVGPDNTWFYLYKRREQDERTAIGGLIVGIGGLIFGGGILFFSNRRGWVCDNGSVAALLPVFTLQILATTMMERMSTNGGNALGLQNKTEPLTLITPSAMW